ncbi:MAG: OmpA family protein [Hyphomicrobiales bacterium]|nr:OmpA family protein [Hyphomicrobiales bacterium]
MRLVLASIVLVAISLPAAAQSGKSYDIPQPKGTWQTPGEIQQPKGTWQTPGEIQQPRGTWQSPGEIQQPRGTWQQPGAIQAPKGVEAVRATVKGCERRLSVVGDALFDFDKASLRLEAEETLTAAGPEIAKLGGKPARIEGHTDGKGSDAYNMKLSETRASIVRDWLVGRNLVPIDTPIKGYGKTRPVAPNATADGQDDPEGRQRNRRVEVVFDTCK